MMKDGIDIFVVIRNDRSPYWLVFTDPLYLLEAWEIENVTHIIRKVENYILNGMYAVGFICYEASRAFDDAFEVHQRCNFLPLAWFGIFDKVAGVNELDEINFYDACNRNFDFKTGQWYPSVSEEEYKEAISRIKKYLVKGDTYQVNYTIRLHTNFSGSAFGYFKKLYKVQRGSYCAFIQTDKFAICSISPELFFKLKGSYLISSPMKGTSRRGLTYEEDRILIDKLYFSIKNRAENVMIVDMVRNDMGKICEAGSVKIKELYKIERYPTVLQMISTVEGKTDADFFNILRALFPPASITGAPKVRTMQIIKEIETTPRGVYTGTVGILGPDRYARFNVAIRTVAIDRVENKAVYGVGGGIVWDSLDNAEYEECIIKAAILKEEFPDFKLLETILWTKSNGFYLLEMHLSRLAKSAEYFLFRCPLKYIRRLLHREEKEKRKSDIENYKVRLLLDRYGKVKTEWHVFDPDEKKEIVLRLADSNVNSSDVFLYHKTTNRIVYEKAKATKCLCDDVILYNERGEITETTIFNLAFEIDEVMYTPAVKCGLLNGVMRQYLIQQRKLKEKVITLDELKSINGVWVMNSLRGLIRASIDNLDEDISNIKKKLPNK